jgi:hypothetical protein
VTGEKAFKNWIDKIAKSIPGFKGYYKKEERRETDQLLREKIAGKLKAVKDVLNEKGQSVTKSGDLGPLDEIARVDKKLEKLSDSIRYADYGYSGFFDQKEISEKTLRSIYEVDLDLMKWVGTFASEVTRDTELSEISKNIDTGFNLLTKRREILEGD